MPMLVPPAPPAQTAEAPSRRFHADHVIGTSMDMVVTGGDAAQAEAAFEAARREIERLERVLSGWREDSELGDLNRSSGPFTASPDLFAVIAGCEAWRAACGGAFSARIGAAEALWREAEASGTQPDFARLRQASLAAENAELRAQLGKVNERLQVLERIATDGSVGVAAQIEALRDPPQTREGTH